MGAELRNKTFFNVLLNLPLPVRFFSKEFVYRIINSDILVSIDHLLGSVLL